MIHTEKLAAQVVGRIVAEGGNDLSDETISRCLSATIGGFKLIRMAIAMRNSGCLEKFWPCP